MTSDARLGSMNTAANATAPALMTAFSASSAITWTPLHELKGLNLDQRLMSPTQQAHKMGHEKS